MEFEFTEKQRAWQQEVHHFIKENATPELMEELKDNTGANGPHHQAWIKKLADKGWLGAGWPREYGGLGWGAFEQWIVNDALDYAGVPGAGTGVTQIGPTIMRVASDEMQKEYLPRIISGEVEFVLGYSEPNAGTDLASLKTRAVIDGDEFVINGQKIWNSGAHYCSHQWLAVRTDTDAPKHEGISVLIVPMDSPGITVRPLWTWGDVRTNETFFDEVRVPRKNLVGEINQGWSYITMALDLERTAIGPTGRMRRLLENLVEYARETQHQGQTLSRHPVVRQQLASLASELKVSRLFSLKCAWMFDQGVIANKEAQMVKVFNTELRTRLADVGMQTMGLFGQLRKGSNWAPLAGEIEQFYREAPFLRFGGGTNEVLRDIIARRGLGLPKH